MKRRESPAQPNGGWPATQADRHAALRRRRVASGSPRCGHHGVKGAAGSRAGGTRQAQRVYNRNTTEIEPKYNRTTTERRAIPSKAAPWQAVPCPTEVAGEPRTSSRSSGERTRRFGAAQRRRKREQTPRTPTAPRNLAVTVQSFSSASACLRAASVWPPNMRASSVTRSLGRSRVISDTVRPVLTCFVTT
jgi:hypothetical protein